MAAFAGLRGSEDFITDERPKDFREALIVTTIAGKAPILALTSQANTEPLKDPEFFRQASVNPETGTVEWPNGADVAPGFLHERGVPV